MLNVYTEETEVKVENKNTMKQCNICKITKDFNEFPKNKDAKDGYRNQCKQCRNNQAKQSYLKKAKRKCRGCLQNKTLNNFSCLGVALYSWTCNICKQFKKTRRHV